MARVLGAVVVAAVLLAVALMLVGENEPQYDPSAAVTTGDTSNRDSLLDEIDVLASQRHAGFSICEDSESDEQMAVRLAEWEQMPRELVPILESSSDPGHLLAAAVMVWRDDSETALRLLGDAALRDPQDPTIASQLLQLCVEIDSCGRARPELERNLIVADKGNVLAWVQVARSRLERRDEQGALSALRQAAAGAVVDSYFAEYIMTFDRALAASADLPTFDRMAAAFGFAAAVPSSSYEISADCGDRAANSAEWRDVCLRLGERLEHDGRTLLTKGVGLGIQIGMHELEGETRSLEQALARQKSFRESYRSLSSQSTRAIELGDATVFRKYLEIFTSAGELAALEYLVEEVTERLPAVASLQEQACQTP